MSLKERLERALAFNESNFAKAFVALGPFRDDQIEEMGGAMVDAIRVETKRTEALTRALIAVAEAADYVRGVSKGFAPHGMDVFAMSECDKFDKAHRALTDELTKLEEGT